MLSNDVLPAPFGPMIDTIAPGGTSRETSCTAVTPPNRLVTAETLSIGSAAGGAADRLTGPRSAKAPAVRSANSIPLVHAVDAPASLQSHATTLPLNVFVFCFRTLAACRSVCGRITHGSYELPIRALGRTCLARPAILNQPSAQWILLRNFHRLEDFEVGDQFLSPCLRPDRQGEDEP